MSFKVKMLTLGLAQTNCFIIGDDASKTAVLIDAPDNAPLILEALAQDDWQLVAILLTHAHWDHVRAARGVKDATGAPIYMHTDDLSLLAEMPERVKHWTGEDELPAPTPDLFVQHGQQLTFPACALEVRHTPGHTLGHVSYVWHEGAVVFSGDCLFEGSVGRTDFPYADPWHADGVNFQAAAQPARRLHSRLRTRTYDHHRARAPDQSVHLRLAGAAWRQPMKQRA
jgi:hydroxyacylglutathione hydrolase